MIVDSKLIDYLEELSNLSLSAPEKERLEVDLGNILNLFEKLDEVDTSGAIERSHPFDRVNNFRDDVVRESMERQLILKNAPEHDDETIIAPMTVE